ncbi:MAG: FprA family A-type flavoprotein [bacterium]|nr:FprA family A-type flavoprotein [bacterium]
MHCIRSITDSIAWVGASDRRLALFENLFPIPRGVSYNSYLIKDDSTALIDTVDASVFRQFLENLLHTLSGKALDYLIVNHMEPDHCACIGELLYRFPGMKLVGNPKTFAMIDKFFEPIAAERKVVVNEGGALSLGSHTLRFYTAPMVHWPEVMVTYEETEQILFSADAFGSFGALNGCLFDDEIDFTKDWLDDARRYYANIVGKYGLPVQAALKKLSALTIRTICPLHGPVWRSDPGRILRQYDLWSRYEPEQRAVALFYGSMYGGTENAVNVLAFRLAEAGVKNIVLYDVSVTHISTLIAEIFRCSHLVFAAPTYNNGVYPAMQNLLHDMTALGLKNRTAAVIENGSWAPVCGRQITEQLAALTDFTLLDPAVTIASTVKEDSLAALDKLAAQLAASLAAD